MSQKPWTGQSVNRIEGQLKVTGTARYAGDYRVPDMLYGYVVNSSITKGKIVEIDTQAAKAIKGIVEVFTYQNRPSLAWFDLQYADMDAPPGSPFRPLQNADIKYNGQPVALVVGESFELARYAASILKITYQEDNYSTDLESNGDKARDPKKGLATFLKPLPAKPKGDFEKAFTHAAARVTAAFSHAAEHHNPIELFATTTVYEDDGKLIIYDKTQGTINCQFYVGNVFGLRYKDIRVISPYVGGAFGSGLRPQYQLFLSVMAALALKRSVRVTLDRQQMFTFGHRPATLQKTRFGADLEGKVIALNHEAVAETSQHEDYTEVVVNWSNMLYPAANTSFDYKLIPLDVFSPLDMRAPGGSTGMHAIESSMDQLAYELKIDPLALRLINYTALDVTANRPYSSKELKACYLQGAEKFGWDKRNPEPRSMRRGHKLVGYGMATGIWEAMQVVARVIAVLNAEGKLEVSSAITDIGTGTLTVMTQIAADELGLPLDDVTFCYGESQMPFAPVQGGSFTVSTVGSAVKAAGKALRKKLLKKAGGLPDSPLRGRKEKEVVFERGGIVLKNNPDVIIYFKDIVAAEKSKLIKTTNTAAPNVFKLRNYTLAAHSAAFVEVEVDEELGTIQVTRAITAVAAGNIINPKMARSQILGGMVWGISKALFEETIMDHRFGKYMNQNLAEYHIPVHADIHDLDVIFVEEKDAIINELGSKGIGEIGLVAMPPAITNAIYHATGKRINRLPIHFDQLL
jgi:xanthine dehydrogenase YagR molybdenum-binding subunit